MQACEKLAWWTIDGPFYRRLNLIGHAVYGDVVREKKRKEMNEAGLIIGRYEKNRERMESGGRRRVGGSSCTRRVLVFDRERAAERAYHHAATVPWGWWESSWIAAMRSGAKQRIAKSVEEDARRRSGDADGDGQRRPWAGYRGVECTLTLIPPRGFHGRALAVTARTSRTTSRGPESNTIRVWAQLLAGRWVQFIQIKKKGSIHKHLHRSCGNAPTTRVHFR